MIITEEDIFIYVFYNSSLENSKKEYIDNNLDAFNTFIDFFKEINKPLDKKETNLLKEKVNHYFNKMNTELFPIIVKPFNKTNGIKLAAASAELEKIINVKSFADNDHNYLIRIVSDATSTKLFFLPAVEPELPLDIQLFPSGNSYKLFNITEPLTIVDEPLLEKIRIAKASE